MLTNIDVTETVKEFQCLIQIFRTGRPTESAMLAMHELLFSLNDQEIEELAMLYFAMNANSKGEYLGRPNRSSNDVLFYIKQMKELFLQIGASTT